MGLVSETIKIADWDRIISGDYLPTQSTDPGPHATILILYVAVGISEVSTELQQRELSTHYPDVPNRA